MNNSQKFSRPRYQKIRELGRNSAEGRVTYLMKDNISEKPVVIKQFQFAKSNSDWSGFKAYEREIKVLSSLENSGIPRYLNSFETSNGFCLVQEYKKAPSLAVNNKFNPEQIKQIAISILEILIYLQNRIPPVIHRDIKPENILVDEQLNVYLVDFGLARIGIGEGAMSSVAAGTFGFMAPEQIYNRSLSNATDLYGLGATLICLLTQTKSNNIETLIDDNGYINFQPLVTHLSKPFINWLEKMVKPKQKDRYSSAEVALSELLPLTITALPDVSLSQNYLKFKFTQINSKLTKNIAVNNSIPQTLLKGKWQVAPHPNEQPHQTDNHPWISFSPNKFKGNNFECSITVDSSKLMANEVYTREILLKTNAQIDTRKLTVEVATAQIPTARKIFMTNISLLVVVLLLAIVSFYPITFAWIILNMAYPNPDSNLITKFLTTLGQLVEYILTIISTIFWCIVGYKWGIKLGWLSFIITIPFSVFLVPIIYSNLMGVLSAIALPSVTASKWNPLQLPSVKAFFNVLLDFIGTGTIVIFSNTFGFLFKKYLQVGFSPRIAMQISGLALALGTSVGVLFLNLSGQSKFSLAQTAMSSFFQFFCTVIIVSTTIIIIYTIRQQNQIIDKYHKSKPYRIQP